MSIESVSGGDSYCNAISINNPLESFSCELLAEYFQYERIFRDRLEQLTSISSWQWPTVTLENLGYWTKITTLRLASYLTEPICNVHEYVRRFETVDDLYPTDAKINNMARKFFLALGIGVYSLLATVTTLPGILLRSLAINLDKEPFIHSKGELKEQPLNKNSFSLLSWNICCIGGGYGITDGGVLPWKDRIDAIVEKIEKENADVLCLYELFDAEASFYLQERLKQRYAHFYFNIGPKSVGPGSGLFVASKFKIESPEFVAFPKEMLVGRTKNCEKGVFSFDIHTEKKQVISLFTTHLQHSEECAFPTSEEIEARRQEMSVIMEKVNKLKDRLVIVTGDLNLDDEEYRASSWGPSFQKGTTYTDPERTWGGDKYCADLVGKRNSPSLNLDHTLIKAINDQQTITTSLVETGFDGTKFQSKALSDHRGQYSIITF